MASDAAALWGRLKCLLGFHKLGKPYIKRLSWAFWACTHRKCERCGRVAVYLYGYDEEGFRHGR